MSLSLLKFQPHFTKYESSLSECMGSHIINYIFMFLYFNMFVFMVARHGFQLCSWAVGPFQILCLVLSYDSCAYALWFMIGRDEPLHVVWMLLLWPIFPGKWMMFRNVFSLLDIRFIDGQYFDEFFTCRLFKINRWQWCPHQVLVG